MGAANEFKFIPGVGPETFQHWLHVYLIVFDIYKFLLKVENSLILDGSHEST